MAVPIGSYAKGVTFGAFQRRVASFRVAGAALRHIPTCFLTCQNSFCVAGAILSQHFQKMCCVFLISFCVAGAALETCRVACFLRIALSALRKTSILKLRSVKFEDVSHEMLVFAAPTCLVASRWLCGAVAVSMGEAARPISVECFKTGCHVVLCGRRGTL